MPISSEKSFCVLLFLTFTMGGCINLKHVGEFSKTSIEGLEKYEKLPESFDQVCKEDCVQKHVRNLRIHNVECDCSPNQKADSITHLMYTTVRDYFYGLTDISDNKLTNYQTDELTTVLATGDFGPLKLNEADVKAYSKVSTLLLRVFTEGYRRKKIREYITQGHEPLQVLIRFLDMNINSNLKGKLEVQKSSIKDFYFDYVRNENLSAYGRTKFAQEYFGRIAEIETKQKALESFSEILQEISEGHHTLYSNIDHLDDEKVKGKLAWLRRRIKNAISSLSNKQGL